LTKSLNIFNNNAETLVIADKKHELNSLIGKIENIGIEFVDFSYDFTNQLSLIFVKYKIQSLIIEGGSKTLQYFIDNNYWDEARIFIGPKQFGSGINAPIIDKKNASIENLGSSVLLFITSNYNLCQDK
jgi:diaminohydroxyphosphoribosylaminopyrimidine deaminase/5-amino-6-(5-phosphoribosylamino)uracil reductase